MVIPKTIYFFLQMIIKWISVFFIESSELSFLLDTNLFFIAFSVQGSPRGHLLCILSYFPVINAGLTPRVKSVSNLIAKGGLAAIQIAHYNASQNS